MHKGPLFLHVPTVPTLNVHRPNHNVSGRCAPDLELALITNRKVPDGAQPVALGAANSRLAT